MTGVLRIPAAFRRILLSFLLTVIAVTAFGQLFDDIKDNTATRKDKPGYSSGWRIAATLGILNSSVNHLGFSARYMNYSNGNYEGTPEETYQPNRKSSVAKGTGFNQELMAIYYFGRIGVGLGGSRITYSNDHFMDQDRGVLGDMRHHVKLTSLNLSLNYSIKFTNHLRFQMGVMAGYPTSVKTTFGKDINASPIYGGELSFIHQIGCRMGLALSFGMKTFSYKYNSLSNQPFTYEESNPWANSSCIWTYDFSQSKLDSQTSFIVNSKVAIYYNLKNH